MKTRNTFLSISILSTCLFAFASEAAPAVSEYESTVLTFEKGSSKLSPEQQRELSKTIVGAKAKGNITKIEIAAWSDSDHPKTGDLSSEERMLASKRLNTIKADLRRDVGRMKYIHEYNMAENSNWVARNLHSSKAELDAVFAKKETGTLERADFSLIQSEGAATRAVVIVRVQDRR